MTVYFVGPSPKYSGRLPIPSITLADGWQRPLAIAAVAVLAALLHGACLFWYLERPAPQAISKAVPLPTIDIALAGSSPPAVTKTAAPPPPPPAKAEPKPLDKKPAPKPKPKPVQKPKIASEVKKPAAKPQVKPEALPDVPAPAAPPVPASQAAPASSHQDKPASASQNNTVTSASANADYLNNPAPVYPRMARQRQWEGRVLLRVFVTAEGNCGELSVQHSSGHDVLDEAALEAVKQWRFVPGKRGDTAIGSWVNVPIEFKLD